MSQQAGGVTPPALHALHCPWLLLGCSSLRGTAEPQLHEQLLQRARFGPAYSNLVINTPGPRVCQLSKSCTEQTEGRTLFSTHEPFQNHEFPCDPSIHPSEHRMHSPELLGEPRSPREGKGGSEQQSQLDVLLSWHCPPHAAPWGLLTWPPSPSWNHGMVWAGTLKIPLVEPRRCSKTQPKSGSEQGTNHQGVQGRRGPEGKARRMSSPRMKCSPLF